MKSAKVLNTIVIVSMLVLAIPTAAIAVSHNTIPGDSFYPIKTSLEKIASALLSPSYGAKSDLEIKLVQRRIEENQNLLLSSGSTQGLSLLVAQAEAAKEYILNSNASEPVKKQAVQKLVQTLRESQQKLDQIAHSPQNQTQTPNTTISKGNHPINTPSPYFPSNPTVPTPTPKPSQNEETNDNIKDTNEDLEEIIDDLKEDTPVFDPAPTSTPDPGLNQNSNKDKEKKEKEKKEKEKSDQPKEFTPDPITPNNTTIDLTDDDSDNDSDDGLVGGSSSDGKNIHLLN